MEVNSFYIFVEGDDDKLFFERLIRSLLSKKYSDCRVDIIKYQQKKNHKIDKLIKGCKNRDMWDYIFVRDFDSDHHNSDRNKVIYKCIKSYPNLQDNVKKIFIVEEEIESWYLAGVNEDKFYIDIEIPPSTDKLSKEKCDVLLNNFGLQFDIDFKEECFKSFDYGLAMERNSSFNYFMKELKLIEEYNL